MYNMITAIFVSVVLFVLAFWATFYTRNNGWEFSNLSWLTTGVSFGAATAGAVMLNLGTYMTYNYTKPAVETDTGGEP